MNERINMLKHLASVWCDENIPELYSEETNGYGKAWEDKFAQLIVAECAAQAEDESSWPYTSFGKKIKDHFGVNNATD